jgi:hypothetical protein
MVVATPETPASYPRGHPYQGVTVCRQLKNGKIGEEEIFMRKLDT